MARPAFREPVAGEEYVREPLPSPVRQAYGLLHFAFTVAPILAGLDKFFNLLVNWSHYLAPQAARILGAQSGTFMKLVGVIEIIAGIGVAVRPRIFAYVVAVWLFSITLNLLAGGFFDIALRDFGLGLGALALARLSLAVHEAGRD